MRGGLGEGARWRALVLGKEGWRKGETHTHWRKGETHILRAHILRAHILKGETHTHS